MEKFIKLNKNLQISIMKFIDTGTYLSVIMKSKQLRHFSMLYTQIHEKFTEILKITNYFQISKNKNTTLDSFSFISLINYCEINFKDGDLISDVLSLYLTFLNEKGLYILYYPLIGRFSFKYLRSDIHSMYNKIISNLDSSKFIFEIKSADTLNLTMLEFISFECFDNLILEESDFIYLNKIQFILNRLTKRVNIVKYYVNNESKKSDLLQYCTRFPSTIKEIIFIEEPYMIKFFKEKEKFEDFLKLIELNKHSLEKLYVADIGTKGNIKKLLSVLKDLTNFKELRIMNWDNSDKKFDVSSLTVNSNKFKFISSNIQLSVYKSGKILEKEDLQKESEFLMKNNHISELHIEFSLGLGDHIIKNFFGEIQLLNFSKLAIGSKDNLNEFFTVLPKFNNLHSLIFNSENIFNKDEVSVCLKNNNYFILLSELMKRNINNNTNFRDVWFYGQYLDDFLNYLYLNNQHLLIYVQKVKTVKNYKYSLPHISHLFHLEAHNHDLIQFSRDITLAIVSLNSDYSNLNVFKNKGIKKFHFRIYNKNTLLYLTNNSESFETLENIKFDFSCIEIDLTGIEKLTNLKFLHLEYWKIGRDNSDIELVKRYAGLTCLSNNK